MPHFRRTCRRPVATTIVSCAIAAYPVVATTDCWAPTHFNDVETTVLSCRVQRFDNDKWLTWFEYVIGHFRHRYDGTVLTVRIDSNSGKVITESEETHASAKLWKPGTKRDVLWLEGQGCNGSIPTRVHFVEVIPCCDVLPLTGACLVNTIPHVSSRVNLSS